jgi:hypothetical protein
MSWAKAVKKACKELDITYDGDNSEGFVTDRSREPHLHCGKDHITYTAVGHSHKGIADGNNLRTTAQEVYDTSGNEEIKQVIKYLQDNY